MKNFVLATTKDGHIDQILLKLPTISETEDLKEAVNFAIDGYFNDLEGDDDEN